MGRNRVDLSKGLWHGGSKAGSPATLQERKEERMAARATVDLDDFYRYVRKGSTESRQLDVVFGGGEVNMNVPGGRGAMRALVSALRKVAAGIERDTGIAKL